MRKIISILPAVAAVLSMTATMAAGSSWPQAGHDAQLTNFNPDERAIRARTVSRLHPVWTFPHLYRAIAAGNRVYGISISPRFDVVVINSPDGKLVHRYTPTSLGLKTTTYEDPLTLAYAAGRLVVGAARDVVAINPETGRAYWRVPGGADQVQISGRTVYTGKGCQNVCGALASYAIDLYTGRLRWTHSGNFGQVPVLVAGHLYQTWGEYTGTTHVYDPATGSMLAQLSLNASWTGDANHAYANVLTSGFNTTTPHSWVGEIGSNGRPVWKTDLGKSFPGMPVLAYNTLFVPSYRFHPGVLAVNASNGNVRWGANVGQNLVLIAANHLLFTVQQQKGQVTILDAGTGRILRRFIPAGYVWNGTSGLMVANGTLYVLDGNAIVAYRP